MMNEKTKNYDEMEAELASDPTGDLAGDNDTLIVAIRDNLPPEAVVAIAAYIHDPRTNDEQTNTAIRWFHDILIDTVGGHEIANGIVDEIGL